MADKISSKTVMGAISDFILLVLMLAAAGFGGYYVGINQRLAPVQLVPPGTAGAKTLEQLGLAPKASSEVIKSKSGDSGSEAFKSASSAAAKNVGVEGASAIGSSSSSSSLRSAKIKYWLSSDGADYCGYSITVSVNGTPVDAFFGPDKIIDVTKLVKKGDNVIAFDAKELGEQYNKHTGDASYAVTVRLVKGPHVQENFKKTDVLLSYGRTAADTKNDNATKHFVGD